ncbi:MAG: AraC family transcriptional regulator [Spirochaetes bacterium]|nr:AraC family transcriptional regulator [Spirochaetota bacterium]
MIDRILNYILFAYAIAIIVFVALQVTTKIRRSVYGFMASINLLLSYYLLYYLSFRTGVIARFPFMAYSDLPVICALGPMIYLYVVSITAKEVLMKRWVRHCALPILVLCYVIMHRLWIGQGIVSGGRYYPSNYGGFSIYPVALLVFSVYVAYAGGTLLKLRSVVIAGQCGRIREIRTVYYFYMVHGAVTLLFLAAHLMRNKRFIDIMTVMNGSIALYYLLFSYRHPEYTQRVIREPKKVKRNDLLPSTVDADEVMNRLMTLLDIDRVYRDPGITIHTLSNTLDIPSHHLSHVLNKRMSVNFRTLINTRRLEEAKRLLAEEPGKSVLEIAYEVGFNSKTAFYRSFVHETGLPPAGYRAKVGKKRPDF